MTNEDDTLSDELHTSKLKRKKRIKNKKNNRKRSKKTDYLSDDESNNSNDISTKKKKSYNNVKRRDEQLGEFLRIWDPLIDKNVFIIKHSRKNSVLFWKVCDI